MNQGALNALVKIVSERERSRLRSRATMFSYLGGAILAVLLINAFALTGWFSWIICALLLMGVIALNFVLQLRIDRMPLDTRQFARLVEEKYQDLDAALLTALEQKPEGPGRELSFLQKKVIEDAVRHSHVYDWPGVISSSSIRRTRFGQYAAIFVFAVIFGILLLPAFERKAVLEEGQVVQELVDETEEEMNLTVTPGDIEVLRGSRLVITAEFEDGKVPVEVLLRLNAEGGENRDIPMQKNLDDPEFGAIIEEVSSDMVYRVVFSKGKSEEFKIKTYVFPELEKIDVIVTPPAHSGKPVKKIEDVRYVSVDELSHLAIDVYVNETVADAHFLGRDKSKLSLAQSEKNSALYVLAMVPEKSMRYSLKLRDSVGRENKKAYRFEIKVRKNKPPQIKMIYPAGDVAVSALEEIEFEADIKDNTALKEYGFSYTYNDIKFSAVLGKGVEGERKAKAKFFLALEDLKVKPDEFISYNFWAEDIGSDGKLRRIESDLFFAEVRRFEHSFSQGMPMEGEGLLNQSVKLIKMQKEVISASWNVKRKLDQNSDFVKQKEPLESTSEAQEVVIELAEELKAKLRDPLSRDLVDEAVVFMKGAIISIGESLEHLSIASLESAIDSEKRALDVLLRLRARHTIIVKARGQGESAGKAVEKLDLELKEQEERYEMARQAQANQDDSARIESLKILARLKELAKRQEVLKERIKEIEAMLAKVKDEEERERLKRELKRLQDEQREMVRNMDDLQEKMDKSKNGERMADAMEDLEKARSSAQQAAKALDQEKMQLAASAAERTGRKLSELHEEFKKQTSSEFAGQMRKMREDIRDIAKTQERLLDDIRNTSNNRDSSSNKNKGLQSLTDNSKEDSPEAQVAKSFGEQKERIGKLIDEMQTVSEESEDSEPILSQKLYDTLRDSDHESLLEDLAYADESVHKNRLDHAFSAGIQAQDTIESLKEGVEDAAESVLGGEDEILRFARSELNDLIAQLGEELSDEKLGGDGQEPEDSQGSGGEGRRSKGEGQGEGQGDSMVQRRGEGQGEDGQGSGGEGRRPKGEGNGSGSGDSMDRELKIGQVQDGKKDQPSEGSSQRQSYSLTLRGGNDSNGGGTDRFGSHGQGGPITGKNFVPWTERLGDLEGIVDIAEFRNELAKVRVRAEDMRLDYKRHGKMPSEELLMEGLLEPLYELRDEVSEELARRGAEDRRVLIDRDPVQQEFKDLVKRYYETIGSGE